MSERVRRGDNEQRGMKLVAAYRRVGMRPKKVTKTINDSIRIKMAIFFNGPIVAK